MPVAAALALATGLGAPYRTLAVTPGEESVYAVTYLRMPTGEARITVGKAEGDVWPVIFQARTGGIAGLLDVREHLVSYWDHPARTSRGSDLRAYEVGDYHVDSMRFDRENGTATVSVERKGRKKVKTIEIVPGTHELTGAFMWLRMQPLAVGDVFRLPVVVSNKTSTLVVEVKGRERVKVPAGRYETLKLSVATEIEGKFASKRPLVMWVTEDPSHVLVKVEADFALGSMVVALKGHTPGVPYTADAR